jgi:HEPN domain-containing protein
MSQEGARYRAGLWLQQAADDLRAARLLQGGGQAAQACFLSQQVGEKAIKALLAADDRDLRSHSLGALLFELGEEPAQRWQRQARLLDKLYAPTRYPDALGDELP